MSKNETASDRAERILNELRAKYSGASVWDVDGSKNHFVAEIEPSTEHPEYDRAIEVIISSKPHKHLKMTQYYTVISGTLELHDGNQVVNLQAGDEHIVKPGNVHWGKSDNEAWVEIYSEPGWTKEDHILV